MLDTRKKRQLLAVTFGFVGMIVATVIFVFMRKLATMHPIYVLNVGSDMFGMVIGYLLFISCIIDVQKNEADLGVFLHLIFVAFMGLFTDACAWLVDGIPSLRVLNYLDNMLYYMCAPLEAYLFWRYMRGFIKLSPKISSLLEKIIGGGLVAAITMRLFNVVTQVYFYIDADGYYQRTGTYSISMTYVITTLVLLTIIVIVERKQLPTYQFIILMVYIFAPFSMTILTLGVYGLSISASVVMGVLLLMYCVINVSQGRAKAVTDRELMLAAAIQEHVLPNVFPPFPERKEFDLFASMRPAKEVGGDFYDFFFLDDDHLALIIADVSGKGIPASLFMMVSKSLIKNQTLSDRGDPAAILSAVNNQLSEGNDLEMFVTAWLGIVTISTGELVYASAGHEYPAIRKGNKDFALVKEKNSPPLATIEGLKFFNHTEVLKPGDALVIYTDGVTEATNDANELFGLDRMLDALSEDPNANAKVLDHNLKHNIHRFIGEAPQFDDITILTFIYYGKKVE